MGAPRSSHKDEKSTRRVPPHSSRKSKKSTQHVPIPSSQSPPTPMEEILEWLKKPMAKSHSSIQQDDIIVHNLSLDSYLHLCCPPSSTSDDFLYHDSLDQSTSPASYAHSHDSQVAGPNCGQVQGSLITQAKE